MNQDDYLMSQQELIFREKAMEFWYQFDEVLLLG